MTQPPVVHRAPHVGGEFDRMIDLVAGCIEGTTSLQRVAHYTSGIYDFGVDVLDDPAFARPESEGSVAVRRARYLRGGQNLTFIVGQEDDKLQDLRTGRLVRTVLHSDNGAIFCTPVRRGEYLTGLSLDGSRKEVDAADNSLAGLVTDVRAVLGLGLQDPGGWRTARPVGAVAALAGYDEESDASALVLRGEEATASAALLGSAVKPQYLHYLALCDDGNVLSTADCLDHPAIQHLFTQMTPETRRHGYSELARRFKVLAAQLGQLMRAAVNGHLVRVVLDVEQGAIYYYRLPGTAYLVGVTLVQSQAGVADQRMAEFAAEYLQRQSGRAGVS